jgi:hypothetical protein
MSVIPVTTLTIDLNGSVANNTTDYDNSSANNPEILLFPNATVTTTGFSPLSNLKGIYLTLSNASPSQIIYLSQRGEGLAIAAGVGFSYSDGVLQLYSEHSTGPTDATWNSILQNIYYSDTSDAPLGSMQTVTLSHAINNIGNYTTTTLGQDTIDVTCFYVGTGIRTPDGETAVEKLKPGDLVLTSAGVAAPVRWLGRQTISTIFSDKLRVLPIRIKEGALSANTPCRDLLISPDHAIFLDGVLVQASALVNGVSIIREKNVPAKFKYYHVELGEHSLIIANGAPVESFVDNVDRLGFDNWAEHERLYPGGKTNAELPYPRAKSHRQLPNRLREALALRANELSGGEPDAA